MIVWFAWLGIILLRYSPKAAAEKVDAFVQHETTTY
jgi:hypothetical protein